MPPIEADPLTFNEEFELLSVETTKLELLRRETFPFTVNVPDIVMFPLLTTLPLTAPVPDNPPLAPIVIWEAAILPPSASVIEPLP